MEHQSALRSDREGVASHIVGFLRAWQQAAMPHYSLVNTKPSSELISCSLAHLQVFTVRALETFFRDCFVLLCKRDSSFLEKATEATKGKIDYATLSALLSGKSSIEEHLAAQRNFQNLDVVNLAFEPLFGRAAFDVLNETTFHPLVPGDPPKTIKIDLSEQPWRAQLYELVDARHQIIHNANRPLPTDQERVLKQADTALLVAQLFGSHLATALRVGTIVTEAPLWMVILMSVAINSNKSPAELMARMVKEIGTNSELRDAKGHIGPAIVFAHHITRLRFAENHPTASAVAEGRDVYHLLSMVGKDFELQTLQGLQKDASGA